MLNNNLSEAIKAAIDSNGIAALNEIVESAAIKAGIAQPVAMVKWVPIDKVCPNDYNPNSVAKKEMTLLYQSIKMDGYTQPVVTIYDKEQDKYVIVDGFHRYFTCKTNPDILERNKGHLPIVVIDKEINDRMSSMVLTMIKNGWDDDRLKTELGMTNEEVVKLKHLTGFSFLFKDATYNNSWQTQSQIRQKLLYAKENNLEVFELV